MLNHLLGFYQKKELYKTIIYSCYNAYKDCYKNVQKSVHYLNTSQLDELSKEQRENYLRNYYIQIELTNEIFSLVKLYCSQYPNESICHYDDFKTYEKYPYRLHQTMDKFIKLL
jgi:hypothetical protein